MRYNVSSDLEYMGMEMKKVLIDIQTPGAAGASVRFRISLIYAWVFFFSIRDLLLLKVQHHTIMGLKKLCFSDIQDYIWMLCIVIIFRSVSSEAVYTEVRRLPLHAQTLCDSSPLLFLLNNAKNLCLQVYGMCCTRNVGDVISVLIGVSSGWIPSC